MNIQMQNLEILPEVPAGIQVYPAFDKYQALCEASLQQNHHIPTNAWIDLGIEIHLSGEEEARMFWEAANIRVWLDSQEISDAKRYSIEPYPFYVELSQYRIEGYAMRMALIVPPLPAGNHQVDWKLFLEQEVWDEGDVYEAGTTWNVTTLLHVAETV